MFFFQAEDGIRDLVLSRGLGDVYKRQPEAVLKIFKAKERPPRNPLSLLVHSKEDIKKVAKNVPENAFKLMDAFWPGPLTIIPVSYTHLTLPTSDLV